MNLRDEVKVFTGEMSSQEEEEKFLTPLRIVALVAWFISFVTIPFLLERIGSIPDGAGFVPATILFLLLFIILFEKFSFRFAVVIVCVSSLGCLYKPIIVNHLIDGLDFRMQDAFFNFRGAKKPSKQVCIVDIDTKSLDIFGQWPWPRSQIAAVVKNLVDDGARVIGFDIVFAEGDRLSLDRWQERLSSAELIEPRRGDEKSPKLVEEVKISKEAVKQLILEEWKRRLEKLDPNFFIDSSLTSDEKERLIVDKYDEISRLKWEEREQEFFDRAKHSGVSYTKRPYPDIETPMESMAKSSKELFYFGRKWDAKELYSKGAVAVMDNDSELGNSFQDRRVVSGGLFITSTSAGAKVARYLRKEASVESTGMILSTGITGAQELFPGIRKALRQVLNVPEVQEMAYHQGMFNIVPDQSGAARYYTMLMDAPVFQQTLVLKDALRTDPTVDVMNLDNYDSKIVAQYFTYPSLAFEMLRVANGYEKVILGKKNEVPGIFLERDKGFTYRGSEEAGRFSSDYYSKDIYPYLLDQQLFFPIDFKGDLCVNFYGYGGRWEPESHYEADYYFPYYSISDVVQNNFQKGTFKDKYVLIGSTDPTLSDLVGSPFRAAFPGLEVHATVLENLISGDLLVDLGRWETLYMFFGLAFCGLGVSFVVAYAPASISSITMLSILFLLPATSYYGLAHGGFIFHFVYPWLAVLVISIMVVTINFFVEGKDRRFVVSQFERMVSGDVLAKLRQDPEGVSLAGQRANISVLFSDVKGFTTISEKIPPQKLVALLNDYLTPMTNIILEHEGFIDKFIGDAIMACWGVPFPDDNHARKCCLAALEQQKKLLEMSGELKEKYGVNISARIGISTGEASAALMGSESRKSYTVMGDVVNLGARLEPACADYGAKILISSETYKAVEDEFEVRLVDKLVVKGKTVLIAIYELVGVKGEVPADLVSKNRLYETALKLHWESKWTTAEIKLKELLETFPEDVAAQNLLKRIKAYRKNPPPEGWDGAYVKTKK